MLLPTTKGGDCPTLPSSLPAPFSMPAGLVASPQLLILALPWAMITTIWPGSRVSPVRDQSSLMAATTSFRWMMSEAYALTAEPADERLMKKAAVRVRALIDSAVCGKPSDTEPKDHS